MKPILFKIGDFVFPSYTLMVMIAVLIATTFGIKIIRARGLPVVYGLDMAILGIIVGFIGGRIAHIIVEEPAYYLENGWRVFYVWQGGFVSWGAHISIWLSWFFYLRWRRQPVWSYFDAAALVLPLADGIGRGGCLLTGCCFGKPTDFFLHLTFTNPASTAYYFFPNTPLHATQIYLMLNGLVISGILWLISKKTPRFPGQLFSIGLALYAVGRFLIEFLRGDTGRGVYFDGMISAGQVAMIFYALAAAGLYFILKKIHEKRDA